MGTGMFALEIAPDLRACGARSVVEIITQGGFIIWIFNAEITSAAVLTWASGGC